MSRINRINSPRTHSGPRSEFGSLGHTFVYMSNTEAEGPGGILVHKETGEVCGEYFFNYSLSTIRKDARKWILHHSVLKPISRRKGISVSKRRSPCRTPLVQLGQGDYTKKIFTL
jgi:hypothetical protein